MLSVFLIFLKSKFSPMMAIGLLMIAVGSYFIYNFESKDSVRLKLEQANNNTIKAVDAANTTKATLENVQISSEVALLTTDNLNTNISNSKKTTTSIKDKAKDSITAVKDKPIIDISPKLKLAMELSGESLERIRISEVNINSIWEAYCVENKYEQCK